MHCQPWFARPRIKYLVSSAEVWRPTIKAEAEVSTIIGFSPVPGICANPQFQETSPSLQDFSCLASNSLPLRSRDTCKRRQSYIELDMQWSWRMSDDLYFKLFSVFRELKMLLEGIFFSRGNQTRGCSIFFNISDQSQSNEMDKKLYHLITFPFQSEKFVINI